MKKMLNVMLGFLSILFIAMPIATFSNKTYEVEQYATIPAEDLQIGITVSEMEFGKTNSTTPTTQTEIYGHFFFDVNQLYDLGMISIDPSLYNPEDSNESKAMFWNGLANEMSSNITLELEANLYNSTNDLIETMKIWEPIDFLWDYSDFNATDSYGNELVNGAPTEETNHLTTFFFDFVVPTDLIEGGYSIVLNITEFIFIDPKDGVHYEITVDNFYYYDNSYYDFFHSDDLKPHQKTVVQSKPDNFVFIQNANATSLYELEVKTVQTTGEQMNTMTIIWIVVGTLLGIVAIVSISAWIKKLNNHKKITHNIEN